MLLSVRHIHLILSLNLNQKFHFHKHFLDSNQTKCDFDISIFNLMDFFFALAIIFFYASVIDSTKWRLKSKDTKLTERVYQFKKKKQKSFSKKLFNSSQFNPLAGFFFSVEFNEYAIMTSISIRVPNLRVKEEKKTLPKSANKNSKQIDEIWEKEF